MDELDPLRVEPLLRGRFGRPYLYVPSCESTQKLLPPDGAEGTVALAEEQTAGRGRLGRTWSAPAGTSLLLSVLLRPPVPGERLPELSLVAGRAVAAAIAAETGLAPILKLPNDVLVDGRKVCGILAEASEGRVALGIGVNVSQREHELPADAPTPPGSLELALGAPVDRAALLAAILVELERAYDKWAASASAS